MLFMKPHLGVGSDMVQVDITEDQTSPDQLREAFQGAASNKVRPRRLTSPDGSADSDDCTIRSRM